MEESECFVNMQSLRSLERERQVQNGVNIILRFSGLSL